MDHDTLIRVEESLKIILLRVESHDKELKFFRKLFFIGIGLMIAVNLGSISLEKMITIFVK